MRTIELDAATWRSVGDFYDAILRAIGAPKAHGRSINALIDSMALGGINEVAAPYTIRICNTAVLQNDVMSEMDSLRRELREASREDVSLEIVA